MATITQPIDVSLLSASIEKRRAEIARRALPNLNKPKLPEEYESVFAALDAQTANCYSEAEELTYQWMELAAIIRSA